MVIWKFDVPAPDEEGRSFVRMPVYSVPVSVGLQDDQMVVWALVDPNRKSTIPVCLLVVNTGRAFAEVSAKWAERFLGTVTSSAGIVWHVFSGKAELP